MAKVVNKPVLLPGQIIEGIEGRIYSIRGSRVMLSYDLAALYQVETKVLMQAVRRNIDRFPDDFSFELTNQEIRTLRSQFVTLEGGLRTHAPHAFTEQGVARSCRADEPQALSARYCAPSGGRRHAYDLSRASARRKSESFRAFPPYKKYDSQFKVVFEAIHELMTPPPQTGKKRIGFIQD